MICETCLKFVTYIFYDTKTATFLCEECYNYFDLIDMTNIAQYY